MSEQTRGWAGRMGGWMDGGTKSHTVGNHHKYGTATFDVFIVLNKEKNQSKTEKNVGFV